jgi:5'-3' exonuclease
MNCGDPVSWLVPGLDGETSRVVYTRTTSPIQTVGRTDGTAVDCVTLACGRFVPVRELVPGHSVKLQAKPKAKKAASDEEATSVRQHSQKQGDRPAVSKAATESRDNLSSGDNARPFGNVRQGSEQQSAGLSDSSDHRMGSDSRPTEHVKVLAIDFLNLLVRAYHSGTKTETHAVRSMFQTVAAAIRELRPELIVFAMDGGHDHRTALLPQYKAHRPEPEPLLQSQKALAEQAIAAAGFQSIRVQGFEADDVLASIARQRSGVVICSCDKDLLALCGVARIYHPWSGGKFMTAEEKLELPAGQVTDFLALCGDSSDGIPGVKGIGPKTAAELLKEFGDLEAILAAATVGAIPGAVGKKLKEQRAEALTCRQVVELRDALKLPELVSWRPRSDWRTTLQAMKLGSVEAIVSSLAPHLKNTPTEGTPVLSASTEQDEQNGRDELRKPILDPPEFKPDQPSRNNEPEFRSPVQSVVPGDAAGSQGIAPGLSGVSSGFVTRSISEPIRQNLNLIQKWDQPDRGMIACWEAGREASGTDTQNPWRAGTMNFIAWQQGFQLCDLCCNLPGECEPMKTLKPASPKPRHEPPARKRAGSLF